MILDRKLIEVGYFLSRLGAENPPDELKASSWKEAYLKFYSSFGENKTEEEFANSLKNIRDHFDSHLPNNRIGWMNIDREPQQLSNLNQEVYDELSSLSDEQLWELVRGFAVTGFKYSLSNKKSKKIKQEQALFFSSEFNGYKKVGVKDEMEYNSQHGLVVDELKGFVEKTILKGVIFNTQKIDLAVEIDGNLKHIYEVKTSSSTQFIYTAVGQLLMHSAGASDIKKWIVLPEPLENKELIACLENLSLKIISYTIEVNKCKFTLM